MKQWIDTVVCRLLGRRCSCDRPSSKDLVNEMRHRKRQEEALKITARRQREDLARAIKGGYQ